MSLDEKFIPVRTAFYEMVGNIFKKIAELLGYPGNPGMPTIPDLQGEINARSEFLESLPTHKTYWPPLQRPETWFEVIFGPDPKPDVVTKVFYESKLEGYYNFYVENYKNLYFLPDYVSEFIQVRLHVCLDLTSLESLREAIFVALLSYSQVVMLRIILAWFVYINPYTFPWYYLVGAVDWTEDILQGVLPSILGVNLTGTIFLGILGRVADSLNHLVFTMPYLPSEGEEIKLFVQGQLKDVLVFRYYPSLWYHYPIPNEVREFWYKERPDILDYMQRVYGDYGIQFLPEGILANLNFFNERIT
nr:hypothetical chloroplast RF89 [Naviculales sp.]WPV76573.1 hypothetical chloroplast RF89 [Naviculales sp.]